jgi:hypothetical protein
MSVKRLEDKESTAEMDLMERLRLSRSCTRSERMYCRVGCLIENLVADKSYDGRVSGIWRRTRYRCVMVEQTCALTR